jgi:hypothetical protein
MDRGCRHPSQTPIGIHSHPNAPKCAWLWDSQACVSRVPHHVLVFFAVLQGLFALGPMRLFLPMMMGVTWWCMVQHRRKTVSVMQEYQAKSMVHSIMVVKLQVKQKQNRSMFARLTYKAVTKMLKLELWQQEVRVDSAKTTNRYSETSKTSPIVGRSTWWSR